MIREDKKRAATEHLEALLLEGIHSGEPIPVDEAWWADKRKQLIEQARQESK